VTIIEKVLCQKMPYPLGQKKKDIEKGQTRNKERSLKHVSYNTRSDGIYKR